MYPKVIPGTWQFSGHWLGSYRLIASNHEIIERGLPSNRDILCPICEYPEAIHLAKEQPDFPLMYWCPECHTIWAWYVARCPDCDGFVWKKDCPEGKVKCTMCNMELDIDFVKEVNEDPEFHQGEETMESYIDE